VVKALDRKLFRDLARLRGQVLAIAVVVAVGVATVVITHGAYRSLLLARDAYFTSYRFADIFAHLVRAPEAIGTRVAAVPGVATVETRVVVDVLLDVPDLPEPATGRLVSIPARGRPALNDIYLRSGRFPDPNSGREVLASEAFAEANHLRPGSRLAAIINGRRQMLEIVGVALSPEFVYEIQGGGTWLPDNRRFGILWMRRNVLAATFDMRGAFNDVSLTLAPGSDTADVIARVDRLLAPYGGLGAYGHDEQISARFLRDELAQNRVSGTIVPAIFLGVAAFLLNVVLARLVATERTQIGVLKAFGYTDFTIGLHYLELALVALAVGAVLGIGLGVWLGRIVNATYAEFYRFPSFPYRFDVMAVLIGIGISAAAAVVGAIGAVRRASALPPAEAMRPEPPPHYRPGPIERLGLHRLLSPAGRIVLRNLERRPLKASLSALGVAFAAAILVVGYFSFDSLEALIDLQFRQVQRDDLTVVFAQPRPAGVVYDLAHLPGVMRVEPFRAVPARVRIGHRSRRVAISGVLPDGRLRRLIDARHHEVRLPSGGAVLTTKLAEVLGARTGDTLTIEILEGARAVRRVAVAGVVDEPIGLSVYMERSALAHLLHEGLTVSGAYLAVDPARMDRLLTRLKELPAVAGSARRGAALKSFNDTIGRSIGVVTTILVLAASAIAVAVIYNSARIALSERARELASLRVLGFTRDETARMLLGEQMVLAAIGTPIGLMLGYGFSWALAMNYQWEMFRIPLVVSSRTYAFAVIVVTLAALATAAVVRRRVHRLDLVSALKTGE